MVRLVPGAARPDDRDAGRPELLLSGHLGRREDSRFAADGPRGLGLDRAPGRDALKLDEDDQRLAVALDGLVACAGTGVGLPFRDRSIRSLSSLCVLEHIGLGRYGDQIDPRGAEKAAAELQRVLAPGGDLYLSVPIEKEDRAYFNAHRAFSIATVLKMISELALEHVVLVQGHRRLSPGEIEMLDSYSPMVFGLFHFRRHTD
jgi:Caenorhabditis protein of unknown function, DUF268